MKTLLILFVFLRSYEAFAGEEYDTGWTAQTLSGYGYRPGDCFNSGLLNISIVGVISSKNVYQAVSMDRFQQVGQSIIGTKRKAGPGRLYIPIRWVAMQYLDFQTEYGKTTKRVTFWEECDKSKEISASEMEKRITGGK